MTVTTARPASAIAELLARNGWPDAQAGGDGRVTIDGATITVRTLPLVGAKLAYWTPPPADGLALLVAVDDDVAPSRWIAALSLVDAVALLGALRALQTVAQALADRDGTEHITDYVAGVLGDLGVAA